MTIPSRPAPAPPMSRGQNAAAGANANIEQLRLQLQQQQLQQQQNGGIQKFTIRLPPPPKTSTNGSLQVANNNAFNRSGSIESNASITRKFPQARYTPATSWDDTPFGTSSDPVNGNLTRKVPPPRPPPPKVQVTGRKMPLPPAQSSNILSTIFKSKKNGKPTTTSGGAARLYAVSSGTSTTATTTTNISQTNSWGMTTTSSSSGNSISNTNWNANWNSSYTSTSLTSLSNTHNVNSSVSVAEAQLISFDSPPSSPTFTQKSNSDCLSVDSFSSDSNFSSPNNGSVSQPESGFEDDFGARSRPATTSPLDPWESFDTFGTDTPGSVYGSTAAISIGTAPVRNLSTINTRIQSSSDNLLCNGKSLLPPAPSLAVPTIIKPKVSQKPRAPKPPLLPKPNFAEHESSDLNTPPSPPMPQCPPPPPPTGVSLLDVISGKADALQLGANNTCDEDDVNKQPYGVALYDFDGIEEGDLNFRENEKIYLLEQVSPEWYRGRTRAGCEGIFPANYIDIKVPLTQASHASTQMTASSFQQHRSYNSVSSLPRIRCLYNFPAEYDGDLALKEDDMVTILYRINEDWLYGEVEGRQGQFPSNFLEYVPVNIPMP